MERLAAGADPRRDHRQEAGGDHDRARSTRRSSSSRCARRSTPASPIVCVDTFIGNGVFQTGSGDADFPISYVASDNVLGGRMAARALAKAIGDKGKVYVSNVKPGVSTTDQREEGFKLEMKNHPNIEVLETQFNDDDANKAAAQVQAVMGRVPDLAGVFGANLFSAIGAANGVKQAGKAGKVKIAGFDAPESIVAPAEGRHLRADDRPASGRDRLFRLHRGLRPSHRQPRSDGDRHRLHRDDQGQHRRSERVEVPLQELVIAVDRRTPPARRRPAALRLTLRAGTA